MVYKPKKKMTPHEVATRLLSQLRYIRRVWVANSEDMNNIPYDMYLADMDYSIKLAKKLLEGKNPDSKTA